MSIDRQLLMAYRSRSAMTDLDEYGGKRSWKKHVWDVGSPSAAYTVTDTDSFPRQRGQAGTRKAKPIWILTKQEMIGWQWHQLDHMLIICTSLQRDNHASTSSLNFLRAGCSFGRPTVLKNQSTEGNSQSQQPHDTITLMNITTTIG